MFRENEGPFENLFRLLSYASAAFGIWAFIIAQGADLLGWGLADLGELIDRTFRLSPGPNLEIPKQHQLESVLTSVLNMKTSEASEEEMVKIAYISGLLRMVGGIPRLASAIIKFVKYVLLMLGLTKLGDMYTEFGGKKNPGAGMVEGLVGEETEEEKEDTTYSEDQARGLMQLMTPSGITKLVNPMQSFKPF